MCVLQAVSFPNIPQGRVALAAVSGRDVQVLQALRQINIQPLPIEGSPHLPGPVCSHADMRLHHLGEGRVVIEHGDAALFHVCDSLGLQVQYAERETDKAYPRDVPFNCFALGHCLIGLLEAVDPIIQEAYQARGFRLLNVRQGYAKCAAAIISKNALITADPSLSILSREGFDCLRITPGYVSLPGYSYGFLGGACFLASPRDLCFLGELSSHPDAGRIRAFCRGHRVEVHSLLKGPLRDVGSVLPLFCTMRQKKAGFVELC